MYVCSSLKKILNAHQLQVLIKNFNTALAITDPLPTDATLQSY